MFGRHHRPDSKEKMRQSKRALFKILKAEWWTNGPRPSIAREKNPNYRGGKVVPCANCGAELYRRPWSLKNHRGMSRKYHFCNHQCMSEWQSKNREFISLAMKKRQPNKRELELNALLQELSLPYRYVGDGQFILGGKCPDFLNTNGQKKLIELYGDYWHKGEDPQDKIDYFSQYGFKALVIWESELDKPTELRKKLLNFDAKR